MANKKNKKNLNIEILNSFAKTQQVKNQKVNNAKKRKEEEKRLKKELEEKKRIEEEKLKEAERVAKIEAKKREIEANELKTFKIKLTTLSPIHIGNGEEYEPINYVIRDNKLYNFNEQIVIEKLFERDGSLPSDAKLSDMYSLVAFFRKEADFIIDNKLYKNSISISKDISKLYSKDFGISNNNDKSINQMLILKQISTFNPYSGNFEPYIPGSSIKGVLQSVLEFSVEESQKLKVSDAIGLNVNNHIAWSIRKTSKGSISQKLEIISKGSTFEFFLTKKNSLSIDDIREQLHNFYKNANIGLFLNYSKDLKSNEGLLRIGRYCGKEFIVKNLLEKDKPKTKSLFRMSEKGARIDELAFGWIKWELIEDKIEYQDNKVNAEDSSCLSVEELVKSYKDISLLINDMRNGKIENFEEIKIELAQEVKKILQQNPKTWDKAKKKALDRKVYIEGVLK